MSLSQAAPLCHLSVTWYLIPGTTVTRFSFAPISSISSAEIIQAHDWQRRSGQPHAWRACRLELSLARRTRSPCEDPRARVGRNEYWSRVSAGVVQVCGMLGFALLPLSPASSRDMRFKTTLLSSHLVMQPHVRRALGSIFAYISIYHLCFPQIKMTFHNWTQCTTQLAAA